MKEYSDQEIIKCLQNRESYVVCYLYDRYLPLIRHMVYLKGGTSEDAKDIFQNALIVMVEKLDNSEFVLTCKFKTFLYCVSVNLWLTVITQRKNAEKYLATSFNDSVDEDYTEFYDSELYQSIFYEMYETLDPKCKKLLKLYWEEGSPKEIAKDLDYSYGYVRKKKCECQAELIKKVKTHPKYIAIKESEELFDHIIYE
jgi:RNA polymerase sigma factor (sigma-70 family)